MNRTKKSIAALLGIGLLTMEAATAYTLSDIDQGVEAPSVVFTVEGDLAKLEGSVGSADDKELLELAAEELEGINGVLNYLNIAR